jgi:hypothetical protein
MILLPEVMRVWRFKIWGGFGTGYNEEKELMKNIVEHFA